MSHSPEDNQTTIVVPTGRIEPLQRSVASLLVVQGSDIGRQYLVRRNELSIGRTREANIVLKDKRISRIHAKIKVQFDRHTKMAAYLVVDQGSTNHVFVNGERITQHVLSTGDKIQIGDTIMRFELLDKIDAQFQADIQRKLRYDDLTGLLTYESFKTALQHELGESEEHRRQLTVVMMDLDHFKQVNDNHGHQMGSFVIAEVGRLIQTNLRRFDISARYGGEEYVSFLPETTIKEALHPVERLHAAIGLHHFRHAEASVKITISMGMAQYPDHGRTLEELVQCADKRLYRAKQEGRNRICID